MSIRSFVETAEQLISLKKYDTALCLICCAIDSCAKEKYAIKENGNRMKKWIDDNIITISQYGLPAIFGSGCKFKIGRKIPNLKTDVEGFTGFEDIIYYLIRCSLIHQCNIDEHIILTKEQYFSYDEKQIIVPITICKGLLKPIHYFLNDEK